MDKVTESMIGTIGGRIESNDTYSDYPALIQILQTKNEVLDKLIVEHEFERDLNLDLINMIEDRLAEKDGLRAKSEPKQTGDHYA